MDQSPLVTLPLGPVLLGLLALLVAVSVVAGLIARRSRALSTASRLAGSDAAELVRAMRQAAIVVSPNGEVMECNGVAEEKLAVAKGQYLKGPIAKVAARVAESGKAELANLALGSQGMTKVDAAPIVFGPNAPLVFLVVHEASEVEVRLAEFAQLLSALAHEIRTPLTAIMGHVENLGSMGPEETELRKRSEALITDQTARLSRLVEDLSKVSRLEAAPLNLRPTNPRSLAEEAISAVYGPAQARQIELLLRSEDGLPRVRADPDRIQQVLINLLDNAIKFTPAAGTVSVTLVPASEGVEISVSDSGPGIPVGDQPHIFDPFFRGSRTDLRAIPGSGLGLTIVRLILTQHGSQIRLSSDGGNRTTFSFDLHAWT